MLFHILLALAAVIATGRVLGALCRRLGQPPVIGEILAGIALGPSLLGQVAPSWADFLLPSSVMPALGVLAQFGVVLYMFCMGLELDLDHLLRRGRSTLVISQTSLVVPYLCGLALAAAMYPQFAGEHGSPLVFALYLGTAMSVTAFPVLARILSDTGLSKTPLGVQALSCAAAVDAQAWCLFALATGAAQSDHMAGMWAIAMALVYLLVMLYVVRPLAGRWAQQLDDIPSTGALAVAFLALLISALVTEGIGIHALFGAFALGAVVPHESRLSLVLRDKLEDLVTVLLLPAFFAFAGMRTELGLVSGLSNWLWCGAIIAVASASKFVGTYVAARLVKVDNRQSICLGLLMNTRGLMELVVLNIGLENGYITPQLFAMMVLMTLVTTLMATPLMALVRRTAVAPEPAIS